MKPFRPFDHLPERLHWSEVGDAADEEGVDPAMNAAPAPLEFTGDVIDERALFWIRELRKPLTGTSWYLRPVPILGNQGKGNPVPVGSAYR
ncbi:MAG: hypothetical protein OXQ31_26555 [Spirochaetaceae bacterium]|nr:hypothetical protein [Spirochaetaceae bacterium]